MLYPMQSGVEPRSCVPRHLSATRCGQMIRLCLSLLASPGLAGLAFAGAEITPFVLGADVSALDVYEEKGATYRDREGRAGDALKILRADGFNCFRLRLFVEPKHEGIVTNDLDYTLALAKRVKASGASFMLDIHYSDTWADPAKQFKPAAWEKLAFDELVGAIRVYTTTVLRRFAEEGVSPDYLQLGNEITNGMLWPDGRVEFRGTDQEAAWGRLSQLLRAAFDGAAEVYAAGPRPKLILHIESMGEPERSIWYFQNIQAAGLSFDIIGMSYYPEWHGGVDALRSTLMAVADAFKKPLLVIETAYPWKNDPHWTDKKHLNWPLTREGQKTFIEDVVAVVRTLPAGLGAGVCYWHPESIRVSGLKAWLGGSCALFDDEGRILPAARAFAPGTR
jgi:arabinogalactan endo-1,4-beta-galactosidase